MMQSSRACSYSLREVGSAMVKCLVGHKTTTVREVAGAAQGTNCGATVFIQLCISAKRPHENRDLDLHAQKSSRTLVWVDTFFGPTSRLDCPLSIALPTEGEREIERKERARERERERNEEVGGRSMKRQRGRERERDGE